MSVVSGERRARAIGVRWAVGCALVALAASVGSVLLRARVPVPIGISYYDDILFVRLATALRDGEWLGGFDALTLSKGPAYPAFMAAMDLLGIPLKVGEQLTYLVAIAALAACVWVVCRRPVVTTAVYVVLAFDPIQLNSQSAELIRDSWHASLGLLVPAAVFLACWMALARVRLVWVVLVAAAAGLVLAVYWLCREEGVAILPTLLVIAAGLPALRLLERGRARRRPAAEPAPVAEPGPAAGPLPSVAPASAVEPGPSVAPAAEPAHPPRPRTVLLRWGITLLAIGVCAVAPVWAVQAVNDDRYGAALSNDLSAGTFARAYADWTRVAGGSDVPLVPITADQLAAVYAVSPAARELEPYLAPAANPWLQLACGGAPGCELPGAFTAWALRDAAAAAGHFSSAAAAQDFFGRLDAEIVSGCDSGELACGTALPAALQPLTRASFGGLASSMLAIVGEVVISEGLFDEPAQFWPDPLGFRPTALAVVTGLPADNAQAQQQMAAFDGTRWLYDALSGLYRVLLLAGTAVASVAITAGWWWVRRSRALLVLAIALLVGFLVRSALLALVDSVDFDATIARYQLASHVLLAGFAAVGAAAVADGLLERRNRARPTPMPSPPADEDVPLENG